MKLFTIPNMLTLGNLLCGCLGILFVMEGRPETASLLIAIALILDFGDGFLARLLNSASPIGKELDSLADVVTFGVLPAFMVYEMILGAGSAVPAFLPYAAFIIALFSALRLAKFNIDTRQSDAFIGLPTPANGLVVASFPFMAGSEDGFYSFAANPCFLAGYAVVISLLLVSEIPLIALKFKNFTWADNKIRFIFLILSGVLLLWLGIPATIFVISLYFLLSVIASRL